MTFLRRFFSRRPAAPAPRVLTPFEMAMQAEAEARELVRTLVAFRASYEDIEAARIDLRDRRLGREALSAGGCRR